MFLLGLWLLGVIIGYICRKAIINAYAGFGPISHWVRYLREAVYFKPTQVRWVKGLCPSNGLYSVNRF